MRRKLYYSLIQWHHNQDRWCIEFGSYDWDDVRHERLEYLHNDIHEDDLAIMLSLDTTDDIEAVLKLLNRQ